MMPSLISKRAAWRIAGCPTTALFFLCSTFQLIAQTTEQTPSLGDLARNVRQEKHSSEHKSARKVLDEDSLPASHRYTYNHQYCHTLPCAQLLMSLPLKAKLLGNSDTADYAVPLIGGIVQLIFGPQLNMEDLASAEQSYFNRNLAAPWRLGAPAKLTYSENTTVSGQPALVAHFIVATHGIPHMGIALFVQAPEQVLTFACSFRKVDFDKADGICQDLINSAEVRLPTEYKVYDPPRYAYQYTNGYDDP